MEDGEGQQQPQPPGEQQPQGPQGRADPPTRPPVDFHLVWRDTSNTPVTMWEPVSPLAFVHLCVVILEMGCGLDVAAALWKAATSPW